MISILQKPDRYVVWTQSPNNNSACRCIGSSHSRHLAIKQAISELESDLEELRKLAGENLTHGPDARCEDARRKDLSRTEQQPKPK